MEDALDKGSKAVSKEFMSLTPWDIFEIHKLLLQLDRTRKLLVSKALQGKGAHFLVCMEEKSQELSH